MKLVRRLLLWMFAGCVLAGCAGVPNPATEPNLPEEKGTGEQRGGADRRILVMLTEIPVRHFQPGAAGGADYRSVKPPSRRGIERLAAEFGFRPIDDWWMPSLGVRCYLAEVRPGAAPEDVVARLSADPRVESAEVVRMFHATGHGDPYYPMQSNAKFLQLDALHSIATGKGVLVAVIDTGVDAAHPDLQGQIEEYENFAENIGREPGVDAKAEIHGTAVAGIIAAKADNGVGIVGVAPSARLLALRACRQIDAQHEGAQCSSFTLAQALQFALVRRARIINLSLAGPRDRLLERLIDKALDQGITVVAAVDPVLAESFPAAYPRVIAVRSTRSRSGSTLPVSTSSAVANSAVMPVPAQAGRSVAAPGEHLLTTVPHAGWGFVSGSSFSAAEISGIAALLLEASPALSPVEVGGLLVQYSARPVSATAGVEESTAAAPEGALDACAMLASVSRNHECPCCTRLASPYPHPPPDRRDSRDRPS